MAKPDWETGPWTQEPGQNSPALEPVSSGVIKTLPPADTPTLVADLPTLSDDIATSNPIYLEIKSALMSKRWLMILAFPLLALLLTAAGSLVVWVLVGDFGREKNALTVASALLLCLVFYAAYPGFFLAWVGFKDEPIRFSRTDRKIYWFRAPRQRWPGFGEIPKFGAPEIRTFEWNHVRGEIVRQVAFTGNTARRDSFLQIAVLEPGSGKVIERFQVGGKSVAGLFSTRVALWETIRRFMEVGPDEVPQAAIEAARNTLVDYLDEFNPLTIADRLPIGTPRIICHLMMILMLPVSPILLCMSVARWVANLTARKVDWGELENTVFKLSPDDPSLTRALNPAIARPEEWQAELLHRQIMAAVWIGFVLAEVAFALWWFS